MKKLGLLSVLLIGTCLNLNSSDTRPGTPDGTPRERRSATPVGNGSSKSTPSTGGSSATAGSNGRTVVVKFNPLGDAKGDDVGAGAAVGSRRDRRSVRRNLSKTFDVVATADADEAQGWGEWLSGCCSSVGTGCAAAASAVWNKGFCGRARCYRRADKFIEKHSGIRMPSDFVLTAAVSAAMNQFEKGFVLEAFSIDMFAESFNRNFKDIFPTFNDFNRFVVTVVGAVSADYLEVYLYNNYGLHLGMTKVLILAAFRQLTEYFVEKRVKAKGQVVKLTKEELEEIIRGVIARERELAASAV